jgi:hypothetical protein
MTLSELIKSIHDLENHLNKFEEKYKLRSEEFYQLATNGKIEQSSDFIEWLGIYEIKRKREQKYQEILTRMLQKKHHVSLPLSE